MTVFDDSCTGRDEIRPKRKDRFKNYNAYKEENVKLYEIFEVLNLNRFFNI